MLKLDFYTRGWETYFRSYTCLVGDEYVYAVFYFWGSTDLYSETFMGERESYTKGFMLESFRGKIFLTSID